MITAADLLLGRASEAPTGTEDPAFREADEEVKDMLTAQEKLAREWWVEWTRSYFPTLVPRTKWKSNSRNVQDGDIALLRYTTKYTAPSYRLCRVVGVKVGEGQKLRCCPEAKEKGRRPEKDVSTQDTRHNHSGGTKDRGHSTSRRARRRKKPAPGRRVEARQEDPEQRRASPEEVQP